MTLAFVLHVAIAGILATYCHLIAGLWVKPIGLPPLDLSRGMADFTFGDSFDVAPSYWAGQYVIYCNGIVFALFYATVAGPLLPGPDVVRGAIFGLILFVLACTLFAPIFLRIGLFMLKVDRNAWATSLIIHLVWGIMIGWLSPILET